ncbi:hypothetical protein A6E03_19600 [Aliivibrio sp. 1S128]|nr:hypothetical protein A6E03_19600 [Aliivibrio sp. 1S128]
MESVISFSEKVRLVFEQNKKAIDLPFFHSFPQNSCESSVCFHAMLVREKFPNMQLEVVLGSNQMNDEHHYWLEVDGLAFDLTCDQFDGIYEPIYAQSEHLMATYFSHTKRFPIMDFVINYLGNTVDVELFSKNKKKIQDWLKVNV